MNLIDEGIVKGLIQLDEEQKQITYLHQNKRRNYTNPEEQVQADTFLKLILVYGYTPERIKQFVPVTMGAMLKEADIIVYKDDNCLSPYIVVECKKEDISELEFIQAVEQGFSYAVTEGAKYVWITSGLKNEYYEVPAEKPKDRITVPDIPQYGVDKLAKFKYAKQGGVANGQKLFELEVVSEDELTRRFKQAHQSLWGGGELNPSSAFDELDKLIFCKIWDERKPRKAGDPYDFQIFSENNAEKTNSSLMNRIKALYEEGRKKDPEVFKEDIRLSPEKLRTVVGYLESVNLGETHFDSKGRAFETFMDSFFRGDFGQFFTPRTIVKFIIGVLPIRNDSLVLDTSCGSGGFLLHALDKVRKQADDYYDKDPVAHYRYWHDFADENLFGIEINEQIARVAKMNMIIHGDGHTNVVAVDGLLPVDDEKGNVFLKGIVSRTNNHGFRYNRFDFIITNPPFGSVMKQTEHAYMQNYSFAMKATDWLNPKSKAALRESQSTEILFIEQCHRFLREGGYLAIVVPDGILTNSSLQYVRDGIEEKYRIVAVISMPQTAFQATGAGVKSSVLFLKKHTAATTEKIGQIKQRLQDDLLYEKQFSKTIETWEMEKKAALKALDKSSAEFEAQKKAINEEYSEKLDALKEELAELYQKEKQTKLSNYPIFMAIAENIGYDATGKTIPQNDFPEITTELSRFIAAIETGRDSFFV